MWPLVSEWCADVLAGTARGYRLVRGLAALLAATALILAFMARWGLVGAVPPLDPRAPSRATSARADASSLPSP